MKNIFPFLLVGGAFFCGLATAHHTENTFNCMNGVTYVTVIKANGVAITPLIRPEGGYYGCQSDDLDMPHLTVKVGG